METIKKVYLYKVCSVCKKNKEATSQSKCPSCRKGPVVAKKKYITNKDLYCEILVSKAQGKLTKPAEKMLILLGNKIIKKFYYTNGDDKYDCLQNGYYQLFQNWFLFDEIKGDNCFAYYTEIFKRGVAAGFNKIYKLKGDDEGLIKVISLTGYSSDGESFDRL